ncbi:hypothetical protein NPIL_469661 [Nephila pilipes]|uniref:Uncharacterized protein n=1 Tax=Nephila pilipes TaxID=299642 RepID=A0A8X6TGH7_NEPPI|nr:hypothetical protein NPIL_469661 [Nephila pilipes]
MGGIPTSPTDGATADIPRCYTVGVERNALRFANRRLQLTFSSRERDACGVCFSLESISIIISVPDLVFQSSLLIIARKEEGVALCGNKLTSPPLIFLSGTCHKNNRATVSSYLDDARAKKHSLPFFFSLSPSLPILFFAPLNDLTPSLCFPPFEGAVSGHALPLLGGGDRPITARHAIQFITAHKRMFIWPVKTERERGGWGAFPWRRKTREQDGSIDRALSSKVKESPLSPPILTSSL